MLRGLLFGLALLCGRPGLTQKTLQAVKAAQAPAVDGRLDDAVWQSAPFATDFIQSFPAFGGAASTKTEAHILYDDNAVYISAHLFSDPAQIRKQLTARDGEQRQDVDYFAVFLDTYNDQQNGFLFLVTTANVQTDVKLNANASYSFGDFGDRSWDAVWQSAVRMTADGWTVEMRIPYIALRFAKRRSKPGVCNSCAFQEATTNTPIGIRWTRTKTATSTNLENMRRSPIYNRLCASAFRLTSAAATGKTRRAVTKRASGSATAAWT